MGRGGSKFTQKCGIITGFIGLGAYFITSLVLIGMAVHVCNMENYCLNMNNNEQRINPDLYEGGRYWLGANHEFVQFPRQQMGLIIAADYDNDKRGTYEDSALVRFYNENIVVRSKEGLRLTLQLALHFKGKYPIKFRYGGIDQWHKMIRLVAIASVKDACQNFEAFDFFESRMRFDRLKWSSSSNKSTITPKQSRKSRATPQ
eukprot:403355718